MRRLSGMLSSRIVLAVGCLAMLAGTAVSRADGGASSSNRSGKFELFAEGGYYKGDDVTSSSNSNTLSLGDNWVGGLGFGINFGPHVNLNVDLLGGPADISVSNSFGFSQSASNGYLLKLMANVDLYLIDGPVTPLLTAGGGVIRTGGDFSNNSVRENDLAFNAGAGVRWDVDQHLFMKLIYRATWNKFKDTDGLALLHGGYFTIGWKF